MALLTVLVVAVDPALAAESSNAICSTEKLPKAIEGFFELTTAFGFIGVIVVWQGSSLLEMLTLSPEQKKELRYRKRDAFRSLVVIFALGPVYSIAGPTMGLPLAECIDLVPW
ncbi:hypothetical protein [Halobaculum sp. EA56]|uniref:hypothetical protein n=1 Tax=Halobaculum sp. EA56 TaxID=3421648 RepID=UPI003EB6AD3F